MWIIERGDDFFYDEATRILKTRAGKGIAAVYTNEEEDLEISLMMETNFLSDKGWGAVGFDGCENHIVSSVRLEDGGGVLEYQENRHSVFRKPGGKISIKIMMLEGYLALPLYEKVATRSFFSGLCEKIRGLFGFPPEVKSSAV